jgi:hypothetical protein
MNLLKRVLYITFGVTIVLYAIQAFSPLRLTGDGIAYLTLADSAASNGVIQALRRPGFAFPKGYPLFIFLFMKAGIFSSATVVISNLLLFVTALILSYRTLVALGFERILSAVACLLTLLSFAAVKFITQGMSDFLFYMLAACTCWLMTLEGRTKWLAILPCAACAIEVRFIGLALIGAIAVIAWPAVKKHPIALAAAGVLGAGLIVAGALAGHHYLSSNLQMFHNNGFWRFAGKNLRSHLQDFGELMVNVPLTKLPPWTYGATLAFGGLTLICFLVGIVRVGGRSRWLAGYLISYSLLIFPWPYTDPRFWTPAMPFVLVAMYLGAKAIWKSLPDAAIAAYCVMFCLAGFGALAYSTSLTFAGPQFAYRYGDGRLTSTYLAHCSSTPPDFEERDALHLLQRYEWHCPEAQ